MNDPFYEDTYLVYKDGKLTRKRDPENLVCDFCCGPLGDSCWTYPCGDIELPLVTDPLGLPARSDDPWGCCMACHPFVEAKDWHGLAERSIKNQMAMIGEVADPFHPLWGLSVANVVAHFERFDAARNGEPYIEHAPYTEH